MSSPSETIDKKARPAHHANDLATSFQNHGPSTLAPTWAELASLSFPLGWYPPDADTSSHVREVKLVKPDWGIKKLELRQAGSRSDYLVATWLGHAGAAVEFPPVDTSKLESANKERLFMLFDPIFSYRAGPTQYTGPARLQESPCQVADLPGCNAVFISHNHYDHLDLSTVLGIMARFQETIWFVPLGNKTWFLQCGANEEQVVELDWWETWEGDFGLEGKKSKSNDGLSRFKISCVPAQHNSGRTGLDQDTSLWCGWVVERFSTDENAATSAKLTRLGSVYHAGDTGYRRIAGSTDVNPAFKEIGKKFGHFDVSFIPIWRGGTMGFISYAGFRLSHQHMPSVHHCSPEDAVEIHKDVNSKNTIAIHFGTFVGSEMESREAVREFYHACDEAHIRDLDSEIVDDKGRAGIVDIGGSFVVEIT